METIEHILAEMRSIHQHSELASRIEEAHRAALTEKAKDIVRTWKRLLDASQQRERNAALAVSDLRAKLQGGRGRAGTQSAHNRRGRTDKI